MNNKTYAVMMLTLLTIITCQIIHIIARGLYMLSTEYTYLYIK